MKQYKKIFKEGWNKTTDYSAGVEYLTDDDDIWKIFLPTDIDTFIGVSGKSGEKEGLENKKRGMKFVVQFGTTDGKIIKTKFFKDKSSANAFVKDLKNKLE